MRYLATGVVIGLLLMVFAAVPVQAQNGAIVVLDSPSYPFQLILWGDTKTGLTVGVAVREDGLTLEGGDRTLTEGLELFLPEQAAPFRKVESTPDIFALMGDEVPVAVWEGDVLEIILALISGDFDFLSERLEAEGMVRAKWVATGVDSLSVPRNIQVSARGSVDRPDGSAARLTAFVKVTFVNLELVADINHIKLR